MFEQENYLIRQAALKVLTNVLIYYINDPEQEESDDDDDDEDDSQSGQ